MRSHQIVHVHAQAVKLEVFVTGKVLPYGKAADLLPAFFMVSGCRIARL